MGSAKDVPRAPHRPSRRSESAARILARVVCFVRRDRSRSSRAEHPPASKHPGPILERATRAQPRSPSAAAVVPAAAGELIPAAPPQGGAEELRFRRLSRLAWATLYRRLFDIAPLECNGCGGRLRFVEVIEDPVQARRELRRRNLPSEPPPLGRSRAPNADDGARVGSNECAWLPMGAVATERCVLDSVSVAPAWLRKRAER